MTKHYKLTGAFLGLFLSACFSASAATPISPKVVFLGDQVTLGWTTAFAANPNWINKGVAVSGWESNGTMDAGLARFQSDVVSQHPAIVHIMFRMDDAAILSPTGSEFYGPSVLSDAKAIVQEAKAANIQVVFGLEPSALTQYKQIITMYAAQNNIPVINYGDVLCGCNGFTSGSSFTQGTGSNGYLMPDPNDGAGVLPTAAGYAIMTPMAQAVINTLGLKLTGGYLQNTSYWQGTYTNVNELTLFHEAQFTPYGQYAGGLVEPFTNSNYLTGSNGTWASSNPLVMSVNQQGHVWAFTPGTANITFVSPAGVRFNMWTMTVKSYD
jgi:Bacterial Ig-like domain (group 2)